MIGRVLTRYKILEEVGQGGMAVVYKGLDTSLGREVAVKVLHPHLAGHVESRARLEREAQAVAKLHHDNILEIFDYSGVDSTESFIVTEFIHGPTLTAFLKDHPIALPEIAVMIASEVARALEHAHGLGVIHRDVKPDNVMITAGGLLKLTDFGIAQIIDKERMTVTGQLLGSPAYMSPELVEGGRLDFRTDVFACGILLYQLATGVLPFRGKNPHEVLKKIAECQFQPPDQVNPLVSGQLAKIITRALARSPDARHPDVKLFRTELCAELATVGIDDPRMSLRDYFAAPEEWTRGYRPKLVAALVENGKSFAAKGRSSAALGAWGRVLTLEPSHAEARALIDGLGQRRRTVRIAATLGAVGMLAGSVALALHFILPSLEHRPDGGAPPGQAAAIDPTRPENPSLQSTNPTPFAPLNPAIVRPRSPIPHPVPPKIEPKRMLALTLVQKNVEVFVDGKSFGVYSQPIEVPTSARELTLHGRCCSDKRIPIRPEQTSVGDVNDPIKLEWNNGSITMITDPDGANIVYTTEADPTPKLGSPHIAIRFPKTAHEEMKVYVSVSARGYASVENHECNAKAGVDVPCHVSLTKKVE